MMINNKKILIIDDSTFMRRIISDIIKMESKNCEIFTAKNGLDGFNLISTIQPDVILLDVEMPIMNGIQVLEKMKESNYQIPTILVSTLAVEGSIETIKALELGAFDFVTKPTNIFHMKNPEYSNEIISKIELSIKYNKKNDNQVKNNSSNAMATATRNFSYISSKSTGIYKDKLVALGCSTGGPKALHRIIPFLPKNLDSAILIVQHMPVGFTHSLAQRLDEISEMRVKEAEDLEIIEKGTVYIAKGGCHMRASKNSLGKHIIKLSTEPPVDSHRPSVNVMMESLANTDYEQIIGIILTGMGTDGSKGLDKLKKCKNTYIMSQDEQTCVVYGMPKAVVDLNLSNEVLSLDNFSKAITNKVGVC